MKSTPLLAITLLFSFHIIQAQISGLNFNSLQNLTGINQLQNYYPDPAALQMLGMTESDIASIAGTSLPKSTDPKKADPEQEAYALTNELLEEILSLKEALDTLGPSLNRDSLLRAGVKKSNVFGHDFFQSGRLELFTKSFDIKAPDNYVLDAEDEINIAVYGYSDYNANFKISKDGYINIPDYGRIYLKGLTFGAARELIRTRIGTFINTQTSTVEVSLNYSRNITVNIVGDVNFPGTYVIPAINSVYNALNAAEGPTEIGSVRRIEVRRSGKTVKVFDLYQFLLSGTQDEEFFLQEGDFIYVPSANKVVSVSGSIRRPMLYELQPEENLHDLIGIAGGLAANAYTGAIQVERFKGDRVEIIDVNLNELKESNMPFLLMDGDSVRIPTIPAEFENFVSIKGAIRFPGKYELKEGYRVSDILKSAGGIRYDTYLDRAYIVRQMDDMSKIVQSFSIREIILNERSGENILLTKFDEIELFSKKDFKERFMVYIDGAVNKPRSVEYVDGLTLNDLIFYGGGLKQSAANNRIELSRVVHFDEDLEISAQDRVVITTIEVDDNLEIDPESKLILLRPMDRVFVRSIYQFGDYGNVTLLGEVKYPGTYSILQKDERILDVVERAGGFTPYAHLKSAHLYRKNELIGDVILNLEEAVRDPQSRSNHILRPDDIIDIPQVNQMVTVTGAINHPDLDSLARISSRYIPGKRAKYYVKHYGGGFDKRARKSTTTVSNPNGSAGYTKKVIFFNRYPKVEEGSLVAVDYKKKKMERDRRDEENPRERLNWNIILPSVIVSTTSILTTTMLFILLENN